MIVIVYNAGIYREYLLPNTMNADYSIILDSSTYGLTGDLELLLEITLEGWKILESNYYSIMHNQEMMLSKFLIDGDIIELISAKNEHMQIIAADVQFQFPVMQKFSTISSARITIGKSKENDIVYYFQKLISGHHAVLERYSDGFYICDTSANGVFYNYQRIDGKRKMDFGDCIDIFGLKLVFLDQIIAVGSNYGKMEINTRNMVPYREVISDHIKKDSVIKRNEKKYFNRSPRKLLPIHTETMEIEAPPNPKIAKEKPVFLTIGPAFTMAIPMLLGCSMAVLSTRLSGNNSSAFMFTGIITAAASAVMGVFWAVMNLKYARKEREEEEQQRFNAYGNYLIRISDSLKDKYRMNERALHDRYPSMEICCSYGEGSALLWNRNETHDDFLYHRLGLGEIPFQIEIIVPKERFTLISDTLQEKPRMIQEEYKTLHQVPVGTDLSKKQLIGLVGGDRKAGAEQIMHILAAGIAANNSYADCKMVFVYDRRQVEDSKNWECMKWFPHVWSQDKRIRYLASDSLEAGDVFFELANVLRQRDQQTESPGKKVRVKPHYFLFLWDASMLEGELIRKYVYEPKVEYGLTAFLMAETREQLPNSCEDIIQNDGFFCGIYHVMEINSEKPTIAFDRVTAENLENFGRNIAKLQVNEIHSSTDIPAELDFFQMYQVHSLKELQVLGRWRKNRTYNSMKALIGKKAGDADCYLDIHEKYHGPHGLIAGTTGSGKSETLQTFMLSLAINFSPDDIGFFIIDFKGGGMANLFSRLPHMAGQISNLSGNQVRRAMISIKSENKRRQKVFGEYGVNNINLYTSLYKNNEAVIPIPHLIIIIDEFAELKREEPDFMQELNSVAQVGRSLGVHLILATQKPGGTVDDNIWSNSKFRLCLRVQDRQDSSDMLHKPDAAFITQSGRCYLQVGNDEIYELFQSGYSGAVFDENIEGRLETAAVLLGRTGKAAAVGGLKRKKTAVKSSGGKKEKTQLDAVIEYLNKTADENGYRYRLKLWLPVLPKKLYLDELKGFENQKFGGNGWSIEKDTWTLSAMIGLCDDPVNQAQFPLKLDFANNGHHVICGTVVSGKSTFLQTLLFSFINKYSPQYLNIYALDFSSKMLAPFEGLAHVGGIIFENEAEKIGKFFNMIQVLMEERKNLFRGGNYSEYIRVYGVKVPAILIIIDNYANFRDKTANTYEEVIIRIAREGAGYGIYLVITSAGFGLSEIPGRIGDHIRTVISLEMGDKFRYMEVLHISHIPVLPEENIKGRGIAIVSGSILEFQTALSMDAKDDFERGNSIIRLCKQMNQFWKGKCAKPIPQIPENPVLSEFVKKEEYEKENIQSLQLPFAYSWEDASIYSVLLRRTYCYSIVGRARTGKTNVLKVLIHGAVAQNARRIIIETKAGKLAKTAEGCAAEYLDTVEKVFAFFKELTPLFVSRNTRKQAFLQEGLVEEEIFDRMKEEEPVFIFISDLAEFFTMLYAKHERIGSMSGFMENILEKGSLHHIYFFGCLNTDEAAKLVGYKAYGYFVSYKSGVHLGGNLSSQRIFNFQNIHYEQLNKTAKKGEGLTPDYEEDTLARKIIIPLATK